MDVQQEVEAVKKELVDLIIAHLKENKIDAKIAQKLAQDFLSILPIKDWQDLVGKLKKLGESYPEAQQVYVEELKKVADMDRDAKLNQMRDHIGQGNMEQAIVVAKTMQGGNINATS